MSVVVFCATTPAQAQSKGNFQKAGDILQIALPLIAGVCAVRQDRTADFAAGLVAQAGTTELLKYGLPDRSWTRRPNGDVHGFPSGHTAAAFYGATNIAKKCVPDKPLIGALAFGAALAVGLSRINSDEHDALQVGAGAAIGYFANGVTLNAGPGRLGIGFSMQF